jgi:hypothetical protein
VDVQRLSELGLLQRAPGDASRSLAELCAAGALVGGVSVAVDVRPDELVGPLCQRLGGAALGLRIEEVRSAPPELWVRLGKMEARWPVPDVHALVGALNQAYRRDPGVLAIAELGAVDGAWQLWCVPKDVWRKLRTQASGDVLNAEALSAFS